MPQLKYKFLGLKPNLPIAILEKLPDFQVFGRPKGQEFPASEEDCKAILKDALWYEQNQNDAPNTKNNKREMTKALQAIQDFKRR